LLAGLSFDACRRRPHGDRRRIRQRQDDGDARDTRAARNGHVHRAAGAIRFEGRDLATLGEAELRAVRGAGIGLVFQEPMTSLNPALTIGRQLAEGLRLHCDLSDAEIRARSIEMLRACRSAIPRPA
jgi:peptide/nickel transport system ATP-binding protein